MISKQEAATELLAIKLARRRLYDYIRYTNSKYKTSWFAETVCTALDKFVTDMKAGRRPILILQAPPQSGKSEMVSRKLPAFLLGVDPSIRIGAASYSDELANAMAQDVRRNLSTREHLRLFPSMEKRGKFDVNRMGEFTAPGGTGSYLGVGVGAGLTGRPIDCLVAGTIVDTNCGPKLIEDLQTLGSSIRILAYRNGKLEYAKLKAFAVRASIGIYRITSIDGRILEVTGDHPVYSGGRYVKAHQLSSGDFLLCNVQQQQNSSGLRCDEKDQSSSDILFDKMFCTESSFGSQMRKMRDNLGSQYLQKILRKLPLRCSLSREFSSTRRNLSDVCKQFFSTASRFWNLCSVLFFTVFQQSPLAQDGFSRESQMEKWRDSFKGTTSFGKSFQDYASVDFDKRQSSLRSLQSFDPSACPSHRQLANEQLVVEFGDSMFKMSSLGPSDDGWGLETDRVASVVRVCEQAVTYDIQVEGAANFFANGMLVHNCGIIDDPVKNEKEALSPVTKEGHWNWFQSVFSTRLSENSGQIVMSTNWAEDDLPARIANHFRGDARLTHLQFPAINLANEVGYNPKFPEGPLVPELHSLEKLLETKSLLSEYWWSAMYQQSAKALGGNVFKEFGVQYYLPKDLPVKFDKVIASWDCTFKDTDGTDFVVGQVWGKAGANSYLLAQTRGRLSFSRTVAEVISLKHQWPQIREILIEDKANGPAVIDVLKAQVPGIIAIEPDGSKLARAHAVTSFWEAHNIWLPSVEIAPWVVEFVNELTRFPAAANDDQVDACTQSLRRLYPLQGRMNISAAALALAMGKS